MTILLFPEGFNPEKPVLRSRKSPLRLPAHLPKKRGWPGYRSHYCKPGGRNTPPRMGIPGGSGTGWGDNRYLKPGDGLPAPQHEKMGKRNTYYMNMPYTDAWIILLPMSNNFGYAITVEKSWA